MLLIVLINGQIREYDNDNNDLTIRQEELGEEG
jgi:hypothetical protein